ncbi:MAG: PDZ domain-containing protein [Opitutaceae bacterium]|nr:PDZ domain-containing protein [Opitutaceae bacterium]
MKTTRYCLASALALAALASTGWAEKKDALIRRLDGDGPRRLMFHGSDGPMEKEKVTFLGVETMPVSRTLASQVGLPRDTGLAVTRVLPGSPAAEAVKEDDVLTKLDDQILVNQAQLRVLIRARQEGDEVGLTLLRGGKEMKVKVKLGVNELPKVADNVLFQREGDGFMPALPLPGLAPDEARDVLRMIGRERGRFVEGPGVRIRAQPGQEFTIVDLPRSNISYADDAGAIDIRSDDQERTLTVKDAQGKVTFEGPITREEQRAKLPPEVRRRLEVLDGAALSFEPGEDFQPEVVPLPPARTSIRHVPAAEAAPAPGRPF